MLPRKERLRASKDFKCLYRQGSSLSGKHFVVYYKPSDRQTSRLGFSISKKFGNAVKRNQARRRLGDIYRKHDEPKSGSFDMVIVARPSAAYMDYQDMEKEITDILNRIDSRGRR
jgi:ribonuclease P protein component